MKEDLLKFYESEGEKIRILLEDEKRKYGTK